MKPPRSVLPLPRYVQRKPLKSSWAYFFNVPSWARKAGCPRNEPLGTDYVKAVERVPRPSCCPHSIRGARAADRTRRRRVRPSERSIGFSPSIGQTGASPNWTPGQGETTRSVFDSLVVMF